MMAGGSGQLADDRTPDAGFPAQPGERAERPT
jgi:hypothetical protein